MHANNRIVSDFHKNEEFYCDKLGYEFQELVNDNKENVLILKYERNYIDLILRSSIKDIKNELKDTGIHPMQMEVDNIDVEKEKLENNGIQILNWIPDKEFLFSDCNGFEVKYIQYEIANLHRDLI